jgi:hypothetical protein
MATSDYPVGYGKPPTHTQFKPGQSGNPTGRPKGLKNLSTDLEEELEQKVIANEGGKKTEITKQRAIIKAMIAKAHTGNTAAAKVLIDLILGIEHAKAQQQVADALSPEDLDILETFKQKILQEAAS